MPKTGRCLCGAVTYSVSQAPDWTGYCHCDSCRRACSAPVAVFVSVRRSAVRWTGATPAVYESSPGARRSFCSACGTPMAFEADWYPGDIHLYPVSLDDPTRVQPTEHVHHEERLPWFDIRDDLKRTDGFGGAGDTAQDG